MQNSLRCYLTRTFSKGEDRSDFPNIGRRENIQSILDFIGNPFSIWQSPFGVQLQPIFQLPSPKGEHHIRIGILGDFNEKDSPGAKCHEIIDAFEFTAHRAAGEDGSTSKIFLLTYNIF